MWLPCTFEDHHSGPSGTYVQKRNGSLTRIDYIACPTAWYAGKVMTWTDASVHAGQSYVDHIATFMQADLYLKLAGGESLHRPRGFEAQAMLTPAGRQKVHDILRRAPSIPWQASPHAHAAVLVGYLQSELGAAFPREGRRKYRHYLSNETWQLHEEVKTLRRQCTRLRNAFRFHFLAAAFQSWKAKTPAPLLAMLSSGWSGEARWTDAMQGRQLGIVARRLKAACKHDRAQYLTTLAEQVQRGAAEAPAAVQRLMGLKRKKPFQPDVLPELQHADGTFCTTPQEIQDRWREHFMQQEDGQATEPSELASFTVDQQKGPIPDALYDLPSPEDVLQAILGAQKGKAVGPDGLPSELGHASPLLLRDLLFPLVCKIGMTGTEPVGFKGGVLARLYKGKGPKSICSSFRAIMLLPTLAKIVHKAFRSSLYQVFETNALPVQLGGRKCTSVVLGSHYTRAFGRWCNAIGCSAITLFADVASAYYCAVRGLTAKKGAAASGSAAEASLERYSDDVQAQLAKPTALARAHASPWLEAITAEFNANTWMYLAGDGRPVVTRQGSRPGSSWADLFYGVTVPRIIALRDELRRGYPEGTTAWIVRWDGRRDLTHPSEVPADWNSATELDDVIWADDLAKCIPVGHAAEAGKIATREAGILAEAFKAHGYTLSFGPAKTAAVLAVRGPGSRKARRELFKGKAMLPVLQEDQGTAMLPLVPTYRHLGVQTAAAGALMPELKHRIALAWSAFRQGRTRVFRSKRVALTKRGALLSTYVMTKLLFASGAWPALGKGEQGAFSHAVMSLYRQTLTIGPEGDQHLTHATVCALLQQPTPEVLLLVERARYLPQLLLAAPDQLWALIRRDPSYVVHLRAAASWMFGWLRNTTATSRIRRAIGHRGSP